MAKLLTVNDINVYYGAIHAIKGISLDVEEGEIVTLIGANGAGKSTTLKTISGIMRPKTGSIEFDGRDITKVPAHKIVEMGLSQVPEGRRIFMQMTVKENLEMGAFTAPKGSIEESLENVYKHFPRLKERYKQIAGTLSGGELQMLAMGRALMSRPKLMMLDEPSMGLAPVLVEDIFEIIHNLHEAGTTILLVEQNARMALSIADRAYVLETGNVTLSGDAKELMNNNFAIRIRLKLEFGEETYRNNKINKEYLRKIVFGDEKNRQIINSIVHPAVKNDFIAWREKTGAKIVAIESAIIFDAKLEDILDKIIFVEAAEDILVKRICFRDNVSEEIAINKIKLQRENAGREKCDAIFINDRNHSLIEQAENFINNLKY